PAARLFVQFVIIIREAETECKERRAKKARFHGVFLMLAAPEAHRAALSPPRSHLLPAGARSRQFRRRRHAIRRTGREESQLLAQVLVDLGELVHILLQKSLCVVTSLANPLAAKRVPRAALLHDIVRRRQIEHIALT